MNFNDFMAPKGSQDEPKWQQKGMQSGLQN
jgi:hypothetical protein